MRGNEGDAELMRDRLKKLILETDILCTTCGENADSYCAEYLAERLIENGGILPLCKVGDEVWFINYLDEIVYIGKICEVRYNGCSCIYKIFRSAEIGDVFAFSDYEIGKTVFLARKEAEQALKGEHHAEIH